MITFIYKCRRCGEKHTNKHEGEVASAIEADCTLADVIIGQATYDKAPRLISAHNCADRRGVGVSDLIGYETRDTVLPL